MDFAKVSGANFMTLGAFEVNLKGRGLLLIQGVNKDDTSAESNGAGKSSLVDAVSWCAYGETARESSGDEVVNKKTGKDTHVCLVLEEDDTEYVICRYRKHTKHKNKLYVYQTVLNGDGDKVQTELTKGTDKETQVVVDQIMGCSLDVFRAGIYAGQEKMPNLPGMTDKQLKLIVEESAGTAVMDSGYQIAKADFMKAGFNLNTAVTASTGLKGRIEAAELSQVDLLRLKVEFETNRTYQCGTQFAQAQASMELYRQAKAEFDATNPNALIAERDGLRRQVEGRDALVKQHKALEKITENAKLNVDVITNSLRYDKLHLDKMVGELEDLKTGILTIEGRVGTPCTDCGRNYAHEHIDGAIEAQNAKITNWSESIVEQKAKLARYVPNVRSLQQAHADAIVAADNFALTLPDITVVAKRIDTIAGELRAIEAIQTRMTNHAKSMRDAKALHDSTKLAVNPNDTLIEKGDRALTKLKLDLGEGVAKLAELQIEVEITEAVAKVYSPAGVRAHILDNVTPFLNERTAEYLSTLSDGNIHATWSTLTKTAKGELREKFGIEVSNDKGAESFKGLSGGEKRKVRLSSFLALQDLVSTRASKPINLFFADEVDDALDDPGLERLMTLLEQKARDRGTVLIISHNSLADWVDQVITVTKKDGLSTVTGAI